MIKSKIAVAMMVVLAGFGASAQDDAQKKTVEADTQPRVIIAEGKPSAKSSTNESSIMISRGDESMVIVAQGGSILDAASAIVSQLPTYVLNLELLSVTNEQNLATAPNKFGTSGKRIPWKKAMEAVLSPLSMHVFEDGAMIKIGPQGKVTALYERQQEDSLSRNRTRLDGNSINFSGGTHIYVALKTIRDLAGISMNLDYMAPEYRMDPELLQQRQEAMAEAAKEANAGAKKESKVAVPTAPPAPKSQTTFSIPPGQRMEWRLVLKEVLDPIGYAIVEENGTVKPMPNDMEAKRRQDKINAMPLVTKLIRVHHAKPENIMEKLKKLNLLRHTRGFMDVSVPKDEKEKIFQSQSAGIASGGSGKQMGAQMQAGGSSFSSLVRKSTPPGLVVADIAENIPLIEEQVKLLDVREKQVLIEALILDLSESKALELGTKWGDIGFRYNSSGHPLPPSPTWETLSEVGSMMSKGHMAMTPITFEAIIKMVTGDKYSRLLSNPTLTVGDHCEAAIQVGKVLPIEQKTTTYAQVGQTSQPIDGVEWLSLQTGIMLWVAPEISADGKMVRLAVHPQITTPGKEIIATSGEKNYEVSTQELDTRVTVPSGGVLMLGGLISPKDGNTIAKVPFLGDIPLLGWLFRYSSTGPSSSHLVILIRPTVLDENEPDTGYEKPSMKIVDPLLERVGKNLDPEYGLYKPMEKEKTIVNKWTGKKDEQAKPTEGLLEKGAEKAPMSEQKTTVTVPASQLPVYPANLDPVVVPAALEPLLLKPPAKGEAEQLKPAPDAVVQPPANVPEKQSQLQSAEQQEKPVVVPVTP